MERTKIVFFDYIHSKLAELKENVKSTTDDLIKELGNLSSKVLIDKARNIETLNIRIAESTNDAVRYLSIDEIIELNTLIELNVHTLAMYYQYKHVGMTTDERTLLIKEFGYQFKTCKIK